MKKVFCVALVVCCLLAGAMADGVDLSALSFDQLVALRQDCQREMMTRDEWQEVIVPQGDYRVGVSIPAGKWVVRCADDYRSSYEASFTWITWGASKPENFYIRDSKGRVEIYNPNNQYYEGGPTEFVIEVEEGDWVSIKGDYNKAVFSTWMGEPDLGFK